MDNNKHISKLTRNEFLELMHDKLGMDFNPNLFTSTSSLRIPLGNGLTRIEHRIYRRLNGEDITDIQLIMNSNRGVFRLDTVKELCDIIDICSKGGDDYEIEKYIRSNLRNIDDEDDD